MKSKTDHPNMLVILADQHRADCIGAYGNAHVRTPHLDALAAGGVRFDNAFCPYPVCTPSRYSLLSGLYVHDHRGWTNHCTLPPEVPTFPALLKQRGYRTAAVGKMHFTPTYLDVGFERMVLAEQDGPGRWDDDYHRELRDAGLVDVNDLEDQRAEYREHARPEYWRSLGALPSNLPAKYHSTEWIADKALGVLDGWTPEGNLLMVGFVKPHHPFDPPREWCDAYDPERIPPLPGWIPQCLPHDTEFGKGYFPHDTLTESAVRKATAYYYAVIEHLDLQVGRMLDVLKRKGVYDTTMVVYTSDHGEYMGFHHLLLKGGYMYDPLVRVPLIIKYPTGHDGGHVSDILTSNVDIAPTLLNQAGCQPASSMHGIDLTARGANHEIIFAEAGRRGQTMARTRRFKLIVTQDPDQDLFYDLKKDPLEMDDRHDDPAYENERNGLKVALGKWHDPALEQKVYLNEDAPVIRQPNVPPRDDARRESIAAYFQQAMAQWQRENAQ